MQFHMPVKLYFGSGQISRLGRIVREELHSKNPVIVTDKGIVQSGLLSGILDQLPGIRVFDGVEANPKSHTINAMAKEMAQDPPDLIIGVGGGSPMDAGKALALLGTNGGRIQDYEGKEKYGPDPLPFLAIPTTCGTGSEVTWVSVITDVDRQFKMSIKGPKLYPRISIVDPDLIATLPAPITASTGLDALTHAVEAYLSKPATLVTDTHALRAVQLILGAIEGAFDNIQDNHQDRENLMMGSTIAGFAFGNSDVTAVHCLSESVGALLDVPHGTANAIFLSHVLAYNLPACRAKMADLARKSGILDKTADKDGTTLSDEAAASGLIRRIEALSRDLGIPKLRDLNIPEDKLATIARMSVENNSNPSNPRELDEADYMAILKTALDQG